MAGFVNRFMKGKTRSGPGEPSSPRGPGEPSSPRGPGEPSSPRGPGEPSSTRSRVTLLSPPPRKDHEVDSGSGSMSDSDSGSESMSDPEMSVDGRMLALGEDKTVVRPKKQRTDIDNETRSAGQAVSDVELLQVAETLGKEWEQAAIHLGVKTKDLDDIKAEERNVAMRKYKMLRLWQRQRPPGKATAQDLLRGLEKMEDLPVKTHQLLKGLEKNRSKPVKKKTSCSSGRESRPGEMSKVKSPKGDGALGELRRIRSEFVQRVSIQVIKGLLDDLRDYEVFSSDDKDSVMENQRNEKDTARCLIDIVIGKRERASRIMIYSIKERDPDLYSTLGLISSLAGVEHVRHQIEGLSSSGSSGQGSLSVFELSDPLDGRADCPEVGPVQEKTLAPERTEVNVNAPGSSSDVDITPVPHTGRAWDRIKSLFLKIFSTRQGRLSGAVCDAPRRTMPESDGTLKEMHFKSQREKCKAAQQSPEYEKVTPRKISKWSFQVQLEGEGTYKCSVTGLVFEVSEQALVRYSVLSWFQFSEFLQDSWRPAGSIYDVDVVNKDPSVLKFIHFPHSLCLAEPEHELSFSVLHVKEQHAEIESTVDFTASHVKWRVSSLSDAGLIIPSSQHGKHHGAVLMYKELGHKNYFSLQVFLALNEPSDIKAIEEQVLKSRKNGIKITETYKHLTCRLEEKFYCLTSEPEGQIEPTNLEFTTAALALKGFFGVCFGKLPPFKLFLKDSDCDEPFLKFTIREDDWHSEEKPGVWEKIRRLSSRFKKTPLVRAAGEGTSDLPSSPHLSPEHPAGQTTSSTTSSPPAPSSATQPAGQTTSSTTSSPPAPSSATQAEGAERELRRIRSKFVQRVSDPVIKGILDDLYDEVLSTEANASVIKNQATTEDQARCLIDMVTKKGGTASQIMIDSMKKRDKYLCITLGLISSPAAGGAE